MLSCGLCSRGRTDPKRLALESATMLKHEGNVLQVDSSKGFAKLKSIVLRCMPTVFVLGILALGWLAVHEINSGATPIELGATPDAQHNDSRILRLPEGKLESGQFRSAPVEEHLIQHRHEVPGRVQYDESRHIVVKAPMEGVLADLLVKPGDKVERGQLLAAIKSPEIGQSRSEILRRQQLINIAQQKLNRERELSKNLYDFFDQLDQGKSGSEIENAFVNRPLGSSRQELLSAYSQLQLAQSWIDKGKGLGESGAISGRTIRERESELAIAIAAFRTIRDQTAFASKQSKLLAEADVEEAQRQCNLAKQTLEALLGYTEEGDQVDTKEALSRLEIRAPFAGTIENRMRSQNERIGKGDALLVLANTDSLYISADIRETDWSAVVVKEGTVLSVTVPALDNCQFQAQVHYVGREVTKESNAIPMIATIENREENLRPGMFVRVSIPVGEPRKTLAVKPESIVQHDNQKFVFAKIAEGAYQRVNVVTGLTSDDWIEITEGLSIGQIVVQHGAFLLKSELLLEGETE